MPHDSDLAKLFIQEIRARLQDSHQRILHCAGQLSDQQLWWRPQESMNSIANILLHLCGNIRQWVINGVSGDADHRNRPEEFADRSMLTKSDLLSRLDNTVTEADRILSGMTAHLLQEARRIQGFDETVMSAVLNSIAHFNGHSQEIVYITRLQLESSYQYAWTPATPEQGAAAG